MSKQSNLQTNEFNFVAYCPLDYACSQLDRKLPQIVSYALIRHDKDFTDDGVLKAPHLHIFIKLKGRRQVEEIKRWFVTTDDKGMQTNVLFKQTLGSCSDAIKYLTHSNCPNKYQYEQNDLITYNIDMNTIDDSNDGTIDILEDYLKGTPLTEMVRRYGKQFLYHYQSYKSIREDIRIEQRISLGTDLIDVDTGECLNSKNIFADETQCFLKY